MVALLTGLLAAGCTSPSPSPSVADGIATLAIGKPAYPKPLTLNPVFDQITLNGKTYALPIVLQQLIDDGWTYDTDQGADSATEFTKQLDAYQSSNITIKGPEDTSVHITAVNPDPRPCMISNSQVWGISLTVENDQEPYPGIHRGVSAVDAETALEAPTYYDDITSTVTAFPEALSTEEAEDLAGGPNQTAMINNAKVVVELGTNFSLPRYTLSYAPVKHMASGYILMPYGDDSTNSDECWKPRYTWLLPSDLSPASVVVDGNPITGLSDYISISAPAPSAFIGGAATYSIDGHRYAMSATGYPECQKITGTDVAQKNAYLLAGMKNTTPIAGNPEKRLLWNRDDSSAAVLVYHGRGQSGDDVMQVVVNYCDWQHHTHMTFLYALVSLDKGIKISDGAANLLLTVASDATSSITWKRG